MDNIEKLSRVYRAKLGRSDYIDTRLGFVDHVTDRGRCRER